MLLMDLLIEPVAIHLGYWSWTGGDIPIQNYLSWFVISLVMALVMQRYQPKLSQSGVRHINPVTNSVFFRHLFYQNLNTLEKTGVIRPYPYLY